jgi:hypothetical protein
MDVAWPKPIGAIFLYIYWKGRGGTIGYKCTSHPSKITKTKKKQTNKQTNKT